MNFLQLTAPDGSPELVNFDAVVRVSVPRVPRRAQRRAASRGDDAPVLEAGAIITLRGGARVAVRESVEYIAAPVRDLEGKGEGGDV